MPHVLGELLAQFLEFTAQDVVFLTFANEKATSDCCLFRQTLGRKNIGITAFVW